MWPRDSLTQMIFCHRCYCLLVLDCTDWSAPQGTNCSSCSCQESCHFVGLELLAFSWSTFERKVQCSPMPWKRWLSWHLFLVCDRFHPALKYQAARQLRPLERHFRPLMHFSSTHHFSHWKIFRINHFRCYHFPLTRDLLHSPLHHHLQRDPIFCQSQRFHHERSFLSMEVKVCFPRHC